MAKLDELFKNLIVRGGSDLHLSAGAPPAMRINGDMSILDSRAFNHEEYKALIYELLSPVEIERFEKNMEMDCGYQLENGSRFRCNVFMQRAGIGAVFRYVPSKIMSLSDLGIPPVVTSIIHKKKGLICVTGPTGSGKTTTLAAMIDYINSTVPGHIITIEDPIEFVYENKKCLINQRELRNHTASFSKALKAALREDPDIILIGEMRDPETISLAITAAETGHLVFGTLHTMNAAKTVDRIINSFPEEEQHQIRIMLSESLNAVISQVLIKRKYNKGRMAAYEIMISNNAIRNYIREEKTYQIPSTMQISRQVGMQTMEMAITDLLERELISEEEASHYIKLAVNTKTETSEGQKQTTNQNRFGNNFSTHRKTDPQRYGTPKAPWSSQNQSLNQKSFRKTS